MPADSKIDLKMLGAIIGVVASIAAAGGSWYVSSYRIEQLEQDVAQLKADDKEVIEKIAETKCFIATIHDIPLPECS